MCRLKQFTPLFTTICRSQDVSQLSDQTALRGDKERAIQNVAGDHSDDRRGFLTILDNVLTVKGSAELACLSLNQEASYKELEGIRKIARRRMSRRRSGGSESAVKNTLTSLGPTLKRLNVALSSTVKFLLRFSRN